MQVKLISEAVGRRRQDRDPVRDAERDEPERLDRADEEGAGQAGVQQAPAGHTVYGNDEDQKSFTETQGLLRKYPDLKGIISPTTVGIAAAGALPVRLAVQGQGAADRPGHAEPDARLRQGRHGQGLRAVEPGRPRLPGRLRRRRAGLRADHRRRGREVHRRQARREDRRARTPSWSSASRPSSPPPTSTSSTSESAQVPGAGRPASRPETPEDHHVQRVCFTLQVDPARLAEYRQRHAAVWPEMLTALRDAGWRDYSLFLRDDGLLVGCFVDRRPRGGPGRDGRRPTSRRWEAEMAPFFVDAAGGETRLPSSTRCSTSTPSWTGWSHGRRR